MTELRENAIAAYNMNEAFQKAKAEKLENEKKILEAERDRLEHFRFERDHRPIVLAEFKSFIRDNLLQCVVEDMMLGALDVDKMDDREINRMHAFTKSFIKENGGAWSILRKAGNVSSLLEEVADTIEADTQEIYDRCDKSDCDNMTIQRDDLEKIIKQVNSKEDYETIKQDIATKVTNAEAGFIAKKKLDDAKMQEVIQKAEERAQKAQIDPAMSAATKDAIQQEAANMVKRARIDIYENTQRTIFEEMVNRFTKSVMNSDVLRESYTLNNGRLDVDRIVTSVRTMYSILETFNTAKLMKIDENFITNMLDEM